MGRGFTSHEHLTKLGLIYANARLYDPLLGRFLSPDPYIQDPDNPQNFNRYSYCLNNPLKYTDPSGKFVVVDSFLVGLIGGGLGRAKQMAWNDLKIWGGLFSVSSPGNVEEFFSRFTWQLPQTIIGFLSAHAMNTFRIKGGVDNVEYLHGATVLKNKGKWGGITLGSFIMGDSDIEAKDDNYLFQHEFGHYLQSQEHGPLWIFTFAIESGLSALVNDSAKHNYFYTEQDANARSFKYFAERYGMEYAKKVWDFTLNPIDGYDSSHSNWRNMNRIEQNIIHLTITLKGNNRIITDNNLLVFQDMTKILYKIVL